ncbi:putative MnhB-related membrane protein [Methanocalculus alkaliphilus]|uniref:hydrogenase subunit MbhD domain-containing protein n=1 Tax=Methanocalculus alkaliphilus TaxID=768730 RepID=UPI0020A08B93|nr:hydrogenase subunit MbhD domain-containing protein [Methanocalculus alkaliphilus]MCP1714380.1 putative MnhB-related membrane protein [Methanocalculus alkaliphilus]
MIWELDFALLLFMICCAIAAITVRDLLHAAIILAAYSLIMTALWAEMNAVDVAFTEAAVGAGITTVLFIAAISRTRRRSSD